MCHSVAEIAQQQSSLEVCQQAELIYLAFHDAFTLFHNCHSLYNKAKLVASEIALLGKW